MSLDIAASNCQEFTEFNTDFLNVSTQRSLSIKHHNIMRRILKENFTFCITNISNLNVKYDLIVLGDIWIF